MEPGWLGWPEASPGTRLEEEEKRLCCPASDGLLCSGLSRDRVAAGAASP